MIWDLKALLLSFHFMFSGLFFVLTDAIVLADRVSYNM